MKIYVVWSDYQGVILGYYSSFEKACERVIEEVNEQECMERFSPSVLEIARKYPEILKEMLEINEEAANFSIMNISYERDENGVYSFWNDDYEGIFLVDVYEEELDTGIVKRDY